MKTLRYEIKDSWTVVGSGNGYQSPFWIFRDKKLPKKTELEKLFFGSYKTFRLRVRDLGNLEIPTSSHDADSMDVMLDGLVQAKKQIRKEQGK
jgi:hypothetical protein